MTCLRYDDVGYIQRIPFVAECEWGSKNDVYDDFEKLLLARADLRVMVFKGDLWDSADAAFADLQAYITACQYTTPHDAFLLVAWFHGVGFEFRRFPQESGVDYDWLT